MNFTSLFNGTFDELYQERVINYLTLWLGDRAKKKKAVVAHSIRVGFRLAHWHEKADVIAAGFLHDILENSPLTYKQLAKEFGEDVANLVRCNTIDKDKGSPIENYADSIKRCAAHSKGALLVRVADLADNLERHFGRLKEVPSKYRRKWELLEEFGAHIVGSHGLFLQLERKFLSYSKIHPDQAWIKNASSQAEL